MGVVADGEALHAYEVEPMCASDGADEPSERFACNRFLCDEHGEGAVLRLVRRERVGKLLRLCEVSGECLFDAGGEPYGAFAERKAHDKVDCQLFRPLSYKTNSPP